MVIAPMAAAHILPVVAPVPACAWCWSVLHPQVAYPEQWSSTICSAHMAWLECKAQSLVRERKRKERV